MKPKKSERNIAEELTQAAKEIKAHKEGKLHPKVVSNDIITARNNLEQSQSQFAALLGVSKRTLEQWEQERRDPSQAAQRLIQIAIQRPDVLIELFGDAAWTRAEPLVGRWPAKSGLLLNWDNYSDTQRKKYTASYFEQLPNEITAVVSGTGVGQGKNDGSMNIKQHL